jgi:hypothetical protein
MKTETDTDSTGAEGLGGGDDALPAGYDASNGTTDTIVEDALTQEQPKQSFFQRNRMMLIVGAVVVLMVAFMGSRIMKSLNAGQGSAVQNIPMTSAPATVQAPVAGAPAPQTPTQAAAPLPQVQNETQAPFAAASIPSGGVPPIASLSAPAQPASGGLQPTAMVQPPYEKQIADDGSKEIQTLRAQIVLKDQEISRLRDRLKTIPPSQKPLQAKTSPRTPMASASVKKAAPKRVASNSAMPSESAPTAAAQGSLAEGFLLRGAHAGLAWIQTPEGSLVSVGKGESIARLGMLTFIDEEAGIVRFGALTLR